MEDPMRTLSTLERERDYYRQVAARLGLKALADAQDFTQMIHDLRRRENKLRQSQEELEKTIAHRTAELVTRNNELSESTLRYDRLVKRIPHGVYTLRVRDTGAMQFDYLSPPLCQILDIDPEEVKRNASLAFSIAHPDDREELARSTREATERRLPFRWEGRFVIRQEVRWIMIESDPTITSTGDIVWNGIVSDISERKALEASIVESRNLLLTIIDTAPIRVFWKDRDLRYLGCNKAFALDAGAEHPKDIIGKDDYQMGWAAQAASYRADDVSVMASGIAKISYDEQQTTPSGETIWRRTSKVPLQGRNNETVGLLGVYEEVTERKQIEEALRESEERYRSILNACPDDITISDIEGRILMTSPAALTMFGYDQEETLRGRLITDFIVPEDRDRALSTLALNLQGIAAGPGEYRGLRKDGSTFDFEVNRAFIRDAHGQPSGIVFVVRDVSSRKQAEKNTARLEAENQQLQKFESLGRMAGAIAHLFNNKLSAVIGNLEMARDDLPPDTAPVTLLTRALQASQQAAAISSQMLTCLGQTTGKHEPLDLSDVCRLSVALIQAAVPNNLMLKVDLPSPGPTIRAIAHQVQQVVTHLVTNAWEACGENQGTLGLKVQTVSAAVITAQHLFPVDWSRKDLDYACLEVTDGGCGIAAKDIDKIFEPFFSSKFSGRGLGLAMVLGIVKAHGGAVTVESAVEQGSTFRVFLPVAAEEIAPQPGNITQLVTREETCTVLLIDDEEMIREMATSMLIRLGYTVLPAHDGVEALEAFKKHRGEIRVVLSDLSMPGMGGWEVLTALRQIQPDIPVVLASGYDESKVFAGDHPEVPQVFLHKPYRKVELQEALAKAMAIPFPLRRRAADGSKPHFTGTAQ